MKISNIPKVAIDFVNGYKDAKMYPKTEVTKSYSIPN